MQKSNRPFDRAYQITSNSSNGWALVSRENASIEQKRPPRLQLPFVRSTLQFPTFLAIGLTSTGQHFAKDVRKVFISGVFEFYEQQEDVSFVERLEKCELKVERAHKLIHRVETI